MGPTISLSLGLVEFGLFLAVLAAGVWFARLWLSDLTERQLARHVAAVGAESRRAAEEIRLEAARLRAELDEAVNGGKRRAVTRVYEALRKAELAVVRAIEPPPPPDLVGYGRSDLDHYMTQNGLPSRSREQILDTFNKNLEKASQLLGQQLQVQQVDQAIRLVDEARSVASVAELEISEPAGKAVKGVLTVLAKRVSDLKNPGGNGGRRVQTVEELQSAVETARDVLKAEMAA